MFARRRPPGAGRAERCGGAGAADGRRWDEVAWPWPRDPWPAGKAYHCRDCDLEVYVRPKIGFCNCTTGVTDDAEVDAVSDMDMITPDFDAPAPGEPVQVVGLRGRVRTYTLKLADGSTRMASGYALSSKCDLLVAAALGRDAGDRREGPRAAGVRARIHWIDEALGRRPSS